MEDELDVPKDYFDYVYSIYGIGWTTDLQGTFDKIASYLKKDGIFIFSWHHSLNYCIAWSCGDREDILIDDKMVMTKSYYDESYFKMPVHDSEIVLCNRKMSTYINALAKAGFVIVPSSFTGAYIPPDEILSTPLPSELILISAYMICGSFLLLRSVTTLTVLTDVGQTADISGC